MSKSPSPFMVDVHQLLPGLIIYRRTDVQHQNWYCRIKLPKEDRYKRISLKTANIEEAKRAAHRHEAIIDTKVQNQLPVFDRLFRDVALEYSAQQKRLAEIGQITMNRWKTIDGHIRLHLNPYVGHFQITLVNQDHSDEYPFWRKKNNAPITLQKHPLHKSPKARPEKEGSEKHHPAKDGTIRQEMTTLRAVMKFAAKKKYIPVTHVPNGGKPQDNARREAFTAAEYKQLHTFGREKWLDEGKSALNRWHRRMAYEFMLVMANTGMRNSEARNLKWRDIDTRTSKEGQTFVVLRVRGKKKHGELIAAANVAEYLERIRALFIDAQKNRLKDTAKDKLGPKADDPVFSTYDGSQAKSLYDTLIADLLEKSGLLYSSTGSRRSIYSFRHTYATFRLAAGTDSHFLAKQMRTTVKMIEDHYGHVEPDKNAALILQGMPDWEITAPQSGATASRVNADAVRATLKPTAKAKAKRKPNSMPKPRTKK